MNIDELFHNYTAAFDSFDAIAIANLYRLPCTTSDVDGVHTFTDKEELIKKFSVNCEAMCNFGYQKAKFNIIDNQPLGEDQCAVTIGWRIETINSNIDFRSLYICHRIGTAWKIFSANVYQGSFRNAT